MHYLTASITLFRAVAAGALLAACGGPENPPPDDGLYADSVYANGRIYTVDDTQPWAEAVAISGGRIVYVGNNAGAVEFIGPDTLSVDLDGRMMLPGFQDAHVHPIGAGVEASACNLNELASVAEYRSTISEYAAANPDVDWILGGGWLMSAFGPGGSPRKGILDELVPDRPVFLTSADGHTGWANSRALEIAGITSDSPDPPDGRIDRDPATGEPSGALQEGAMSLVTRHIPPETSETRQAGLRYAVELLNGYGITSIQDASVREDDLQTYEALESRGELTLRVVASLWWRRDRGLEQLDELVALRERHDDGGLVRPRTVKIMQDGVMENYTAALLEPYLLPDAPKGIPMVEPARLRQAVTALDAEGFQVHFHAIGDAAVRQCLDAVEEALYENGQLGNRHHISHLQLIDPADIPRFDELSVVANFQPLWAYADEYITELTAPFLGDERMRWNYPIRSVVETGATVAFGSDWSVSTANPFHQIETAITRMGATYDPTGEPFVPQEAVDLETALRAFTLNAAFVNHQEDATGSIEVGKLADLVVVDQNLFEIAPEDISETRALLTLFAGRPVHGDPHEL